MTDFSNDIEQCLRVLKSGGVILYPTDTIWGIGCDATDENAVERVMEIKRRPQNKSFVVLVADENDVLKYTAGPDLEVFNYLEKTERPTTVVYDHAIGIAGNALAADGSVAIRIVRDPFCRQLIRRFRKPLLSTSANLSGEPSPANFGAISAEIIQNVDYVVEHRRNDTAAALPSSIIKWGSDGKFTILRP
ncbi:MAG TPA: L-threonylcarbamoyladenylate synthase [Chitinophagaceae bacterium]